MKVRDLINELEKVEDKDLEVAIHAGIVFNSIRKVSQKVIDGDADVLKYTPSLAGEAIVFLHRGELNGS